MQVPIKKSKGDRKEEAFIATSGKSSAGKTSDGLEKTVKQEPKHKLKKKKTISQIESSADTASKRNNYSKRKSEKS